MASPDYGVCFSVSQKRKCKFARRCKIYSDENYTCTHMGGKYCGNYREINSKKKETNKAYQIA